MTKFYNRSSERPLRRRLRREMPKAEVALWSALRGKQLAITKFRRQYSVGPYVVDFYCNQAKLAIELDGDSHYATEQREYDARRQAYIEAFGVRVLRFTNDDVLTNLEGVVEAIARAITPPTPP